MIILGGVEDNLALLVWARVSEPFLGLLRQELWIRALFTETCFFLILIPG